MSFFAKAGQFTTPVSTGNFSVTGLGFQPKAIIFKLTEVRASADTHVFNGTVQGIGFGFSTGPSDNYAWFGLTDNGSGSDCKQYRSSVDCIYSTTQYSSTRVRGRINSFDSDGFTINLGTALSATNVEYLALGGTDITGAKAFAFDDKTSTGTHPITGIGFEPKLLIFGDAWTNTTVELNAASTNSSIRPQLSFVTAANSVSMVMAVSPLNASSSTLMTSLRTDNKALVYGFISSSSPVTLATLSSMDSDGFTLNYSAAFATATRRCGLALGGSFRVACGSVTEPGTAIAVDEVVDFYPRAGLLMSQGRVDTTTMAGGTSNIEIDNSWGLWALDGGHYTTSWSAYQGTGAEMLSGKNQDDTFEVLDQTNTITAGAVSQFTLDGSSNLNANFSFSLVTGTGIEIAYLLFGESFSPAGAGGDRYNYRRTFPGF